MECTRGRKEDISTSEVGTVWLLSPLRHTRAVPDGMQNVQPRLPLLACCVRSEMRRLRKRTAPGFTWRETLTEALRTSFRTWPKWSGLSKEVDCGPFKVDQTAVVGKHLLSVIETLNDIYGNAPCWNRSLLSAVTRQIQWLLHSAHLLLKKVWKLSGTDQILGAVVKMWVLCELISACFIFLASRWWMWAPL